MVFLSALTLGLLGSFHCIGMCGPIAIALPLSNESWFAKISGGILYNIGRTITYAVIGAVFGLVGMGFRLGGLQQWVSIIMGSIMVLSVLFPLMGRKLFRIENTVNAITDKLKSGFKKMFSKRSLSSLFIIGLLNGFLPCGLVYIAVAGALTTGEVLQGALYMLIFGLGTIPVMMSLSLLGNLVSLKFRNFIRKIVPVIIVIIGILFILRGLNLGIKYISPKMSKTDSVKMECCH